MKKPMTTEELFYKILDILKDKGRLPEILDYSLADRTRFQSQLMNLS